MRYLLFHPKSIHRWDIAEKLQTRGTRRRFLMPHRMAYSRRVLPARVSHHGPRRKIGRCFCFTRLREKAYSNFSTMGNNKYWRENAEKKKKEGQSVWRNNAREFSRANDRRSRISRAAHSLRRLRQQSFFAESVSSDKICQLWARNFAPQRHLPTG